MYGDYSPPERKAPKFAVDHKVKITKKKCIFEKEYTPRWTEEVFTVSTLPTSTNHQLNTGTIQICHQSFLILQSWLRIREEEDQSLDSVSCQCTSDHTNLPQPVKTLTREASDVVGE